MNAAPGAQALFTRHTEDMGETSFETVRVTRAEAALLRLLRDEPALVENLRRCTAPLEHEQLMLQRLRVRLIRAIGAQRKAAAGIRAQRAD